MNTTQESNTLVEKTDQEILTELNEGYLAADQAGDVGWYDRVLAEDFTATLPDLIFRNKREFLEMMSRPRPFTELTMYDPIVRILGDFALVHARVTYTTRDGVKRKARYTDDYQRRNGQWVCIAANVTAEGV